MLAGGMRCLGQKHCTANSMSIIFVSIPLAHQVPQRWCRRAQMDAYTCSGFCHKRGTKLLFDSEGIASSLKVACCKHNPEKCPSKEWSELCICGITSQNVQECSGPIEDQNHRRWFLYRWFMGQTLGNAAIKNEIRVNQRITMGYGFQMESNRLLGMANPPSTLLSQRPERQMPLPGLPHRWAWPHDQLGYWDLRKSQLESFPENFGFQIKGTYLAAASPFLLYTLNTDMLPGAMETSCNHEKRKRKNKLSIHKDRKQPDQC